MIHNNKKPLNKKVGEKERHEYYELQLIQDLDKIIKVRKPRKCESGGKIKYSEKKLKN